MIVTTSAYTVMDQWHVIVRVCDYVGPGNLVVWERSATVPAASDSSMTHADALAYVCEAMLDLAYDRG